jgi:Prokaryotic Cytochrome C oxidase subunit IV
MMKSINRLTLTWILLSGITIVSWQLGLKHAGHALQLNTGITAGVIAFSLVKTRFIMREFMDVRHAPASIKWLTDIWLVVVFAILMTVYYKAS